MDQSLEVTNIKNESTDSILSAQLESVKQESDFLVKSEMYIKKEPREDECQFPVIAGTSYETCLSYDMKIEMDEPIIKIKCEDLKNDIMQDPLDIGDEIKVQQHFPNDLDDVDSRIKTESTDEEKDGNLLEPNKVDSHSSGSYQLLINNSPDCKKYVCNECTKAFRLKGDLNRHLLIHLGEKPFTCGICQKSFTRKGDMVKHMLIHTGEKPHVCVACKKVFRYKSHLNKHKLIHSGVKAFSCNECNKSFTHKSSLVVHKRIHIGDKPFACDLCNKTFTDKTNLIQHRRQHTGEKPYSCDICYKSFIRKDHLNAHTRTHKH